MRRRGLASKGAPIILRGTGWPEVPIPGLAHRSPPISHRARINGTTYFVTTNEGDARDYDGYSEETRVGKLKLDPQKYPDAKLLQDNKALGRLKTTTAKGDTDGDGDIDQIHAYVGRSFSIFTADGTMVFDSGDEFSDRLSGDYPTWFNSEGQESNYDKRSDDKGTEPEGVAVGIVNGKRLAFTGLERMGGIMVYDIPESMTFQIPRLPSSQLTY